MAQQTIVDLGPATGAAPELLDEVRTSTGALVKALAGPAAVLRHLSPTRLARRYPAQSARASRRRRVRPRAAQRPAAHSELAASGARVMAAGDDERRRVVRNLHDGAQQRLVQALLMMNLAARELRQDPQRATQLIDEAIDQIMRGIDELCALAHGVMPAVLTRCGLSAGIKALSDRLPMPVDIDLDVGRLAPTIEATAYFVAAEALTNVARHARADRAQVTARIERNCLHLEIRDNGIGGVKPGGRGLVGLRDRVAVVNGRLHVTEPAEGGTLVTIDIPLPG